MQLKWHDAEATFAEGLASRGDRRIGRVIERVWRSGGTFQEWSERFDLDRWTDAMAAEGLDADWYVTRHRHEDEVLPWDHVSAGLHKDFLWQEWRAALARARPPRLPVDALLRLWRVHRPRTRARRRVARSRPRAGARGPARTSTVAAWVTGVASTGARHVRGDTGFPVRLRFSKHGKVRFVGHRDLARTFERAFRVAALPLAFTQGFSPRPKVSLGLALGVGHESDAEYLDLELVEPIDVDALAGALAGALPEGVEVDGVARARPAGARAPRGDHDASSTTSARPRSRAACCTTPSSRCSRRTSFASRRRARGGPSSKTSAPESSSWSLLDDDLLHAEVATKPRGIRPTELLGAAPSRRGRRPRRGEDRVLRTKQWIERDGARHEPLAADRAPRASDDARDMSKGLIDVGRHDHTRDQRGAPAEHGFGSDGAIRDQTHRLTARPGHHGAAGAARRGGRNRRKPGSAGASSALRPRPRTTSAHRRARRLA